MKKEKGSLSFQVNDRRFWIEKDSAVDDAEVPDRKYPSYVEELKARTELAEKKLKAKLKELEKENQAFRSRLQKNTSANAEREKLDLIKNFLEIVDNLERTLEAFDKTTNLENLREGVKLNLDLFLNKLKTVGVEPLDLLHRSFDPHEAEAVDVISVKDTKLDQKIVAILQRGYRWKDQLLRVAKVRIGKHQIEGSTES